MYSKMLRQFSKGSLISISSESSKIHLLIKVLYRPIWFNLCRRYFLFHALNVSLCYQQQCNFMMSQYLILQDTCVRGHSHIESFHSLRENDAKFQTHSPSTLHVKMPNLPKINVRNFTYKVRVGILTKLSFLSLKCINNYMHILARKQIYYIASSAHPCPFLCPLW